MNMNKDEDFYVKEYKRYADIYRDICMKSRNNQRGMQIAELRKKYGLKKSDIETLFKFVEECYDKISSDATNGKWYDFEIYKPICSEAERRLIAEGKLQFEMDEKTEERTVEDFDEECFIRITDNVSLILKKLSEDNIDITNASLLARLGEDEKLRNLWNRISSVSISESNILTKGVKDIPSEKQQEKKKVWIRGILQSAYCEVKTFTWKDYRNILPLGLYFDYVIKRYKCVYYDKKTDSRKEMRLDDLKYIELMNQSILEEPEKEMKERFNIENYIQEVQKETMKIKVYREANVIQKIENLLKYNQCTKEEADDYVVFRFKTDDPDEYMKVFNSYGRSVVILEPKRLQEDVLEMISNTLQKYEEIEKQTS